MDPGQVEESASSECDAVHPTVSLLFEQQMERSSNIHRYDRDEMMVLSKAPLSVARPDYLSTDFDGDDGKFSPFMWLQHKWIVDGIESRPIVTKKKVDSLKVEATNEEGTVLSPQRRGFSGGCCPPEDKTTDANGAARRPGWNDPKTRWTDEKRSAEERRKTHGGRNERGDGGEEWRVSTRNKSWREGDEQKKTDFKLPFQKTGDKARTASSSSATGSSWRAQNSDQKDFRPSFGRNAKDGNVRRGMYREEERIEKLPEWAEDGGPATMDELIELRGFEDQPKRNKNKKATPAEKEKENKDKPKEKEKKKEKDPKQQQKAQGNGEKAKESSHTDVEAVLQAGLPSTDAEFAAIMGLIDDANFKLQHDTANVVQQREDSGSVPVTGSRLSRFFNKPRSSDNAGGDVPAVAQSFPHQLGQSSAAFSASSDHPNPMLAKLFANSRSSSGNATPPPQNQQNMPARPPMPSGVRGLSLEEIERGLAPQTQHRPPSPTRGNPLKDPIEQANLLSKLQRLSTAQEGSVSPPPQVPAPGGSMHSLGPGGLPVSSAPAPGSLPPFAQHLPQPQGGGGRMPPMPQISEAFPGITPGQYYMMNQFYTQALVQASQACGGIPPPHVVEQIRQLAVRQMLLTHNKVAMLQQQQAQQMQQQHKPPQTTSLIPASVQKNMKSSSSNDGRGDEQRHQMGGGGGPSQGYDEENTAKAAAALHKQSSQASYHAMMQAMQGGLPMGAWRGVPPPQAPQPPQMPPGANPLAFLQQQMLMARQQQQHHQHQQQQHQHQQQQQQHQMEAARMLELQQLKRRLNMQADASELAPPVPTSEDFSQPIQNPLEKLLAAAGVHPSQASHPTVEDAPSDPAPSILSRLPPTARPLSLEELERQLTSSK